MAKRAISLLTGQEKRVRKLRDLGLMVCEMVLDIVPEPPDAGCTCHMGHPPCSDCVEHSFTREMLDTARRAVRLAQQHPEDLEA